MASLRRTGGGDTTRAAATRRALLGATLVVPGLALLPLSACHQPVAFQSLDVSGSQWGQGFQLKDGDGRDRSLAEFRGQVVLLFFGFTQCPDVCPTALTRAAQVMRLLGPDSARLQVIFVTVDPERDSPAVLKAYTKAFHPGFLGLWGDLLTTQAVAREFKVFYQKIPTGSSYTMDHTAISYVVDPGGRLRLAVKHAQTAESLAADITTLLAERSS